jgi:excisionase family DNA binding protein
VLFLWTNVACVRYCCLSRRRWCSGPGGKVPTDETFLTVQEVADLMRVSTMTVYRLIKSGDLRATRVGRSYRLRAGEVDSYLDRGHTV